MGDILLQCNGGTPTPAGQPVPTANITVFLNAPVTNSFLGNNNSPLLLIDEPPTANQVLAPSIPLGDANALSSFGGPPLVGNGLGVNYAAGGVPNVFAGFQPYSNGIDFFDLPVDPNGAIRTFRITDVFVNANGLAASSAGQPLSVTLRIANAPKTSIPLFGDAVFVPVQPCGAVPACTPERSLQTDVSTAARKHDKDVNPSLLLIDPTLSPDATGSTMSFEEEVPGVFFLGPGGFPLAPNIASGAAGVQLGATFTNVPPGVAIFVSTTNFPGPTGQDRLAPRAGSGAQATLLSGGAAAGSTGLTQLTVTNGTATAVWQVNSVDPSVKNTLNFRMYPAFHSGGTIATAPPAPTNINVQMGYMSAAGGPQFAAPAGPPRTVFTINSATGLTPQLAASVDARPCLVGTPYPDPANACSPGNNPQVTISSDSGTLVPLFSAITSGGVNVASTFSPINTPVNGTLTVTAPGAAPGTYQQTLKITAAGAGNSLSVPYSVTVLPPASPFIKPGGVTDAFSFAAGSIAPGQVFALFGSNFGPSSGLVSGTVNPAGIVSTTISNTQVLFDGVAAPLLYVTQNQLAGVAPFGIKGKTATSVQVVYNNVKSPALSVPVSSGSLSIASADGSGGAGGVIINKDGSVNSPTNPASVGDTVVIYAAYAGPFANGVTGTDGRTTTGPPYPGPAGALSVKFGTTTATNVPYFGNVPTLLESVMQINVVIPPGVVSGAHIPVKLTAGSIANTPGITIAVK